MTLILAWGFTLTLASLELKVNVVGQRSYAENCVCMHISLLLALRARSKVRFKVKCMAGTWQSILLIIILVYYRFFLKVNR